MDLFSDIKAMIMKILGIGGEAVTPEAHLHFDLGADSLDLVELIMSMEEEFDIEISDEDAEGLETVKDAIDYINERS